MHANLGITVLAKVNLTIMLIPHLKKKKSTGQCQCLLVKIGHTGIKKAKSSKYLLTT